MVKIFSECFQGQNQRVYYRLAQFKWQKTREFCKQINEDLSQGHVISSLELENTDLSVLTLVPQKAMKC